MATAGVGITDLVEELEARYQVLDVEERQQSALMRMRKLLASTAGHRLPDWLGALKVEQLDELCETVLRGDMDLDDAALVAIAQAVGKLEAAKD